MQIGENVFFVDFVKKFVLLMLQLKQSNQGPNYEYACQSREELISDKKRLLCNGDKWEPELARNIEFSTDIESNYFETTVTGL